MSSDYQVRALRESAFFKGVAPEEKEVLAGLGAVRHFDVGAVLFRVGQRPSGLYLVLEGVVEVCRPEEPDGEPHPVVYLPRGAVLAGSKVITGTPFRSLARFPEGGAVLQWPRPVILRRLYEAREFAMQYLHNLARRLEGSFETLGSGRGRELSGSLDRFDLPTILQTVVDSGVAGALVVRDARGDTFGTIHTSDRVLGQMRCGVLTGAEAFLEILLCPPQKGTFAFKSVGKQPETDHSFALHPLLLEAARLTDEMQRLAREVADDVPLQRASRQLTWTGDATADLAEQIWDEVAARRVGWGELGPRLRRGRGSVAVVVREMIQAGLLGADPAGAPVPDGRF